MNQQPSAPSRNPHLKTIAIVLAVGSAASLAGWSNARRATPPATTQTVESSVVAPVTNVPNATGSATPEQVLDAIPDPLVPSSTTGAKVKKVDTEIARWKAMARSKPNEPTYWVNLGDAVMQKSRELMDPNYYDYGEKAYLRSLTLSDRNPEAMLGMAWVAGERHQFANSIEWANKALVIAPQLHAAHGLIGDAYVEIGDYEAAFKSYQTMLDIRPDISSYSRGAHLLYITGDTRKAIWLMDKAVKSGGPYAENTAWCRAQLATMYLDTGALVPAEQLLKKALKATPDNYHVLAAVARAQEMRGDLKGAIATYEKAIAVTPQHNALIALGDLYAATGDKARSEKLYEQVDAAHEHYLKHGVNGELYMARFWADHNRQMDRALKIAEATSDLNNPVDADAVAWVFYKSGKNDEARKMIDLALVKGGKEPVRLYHAGMIYAKAGQRVAAQNFLYQALNRNPQFSLIGAPEAVATMRMLGSLPNTAAENALRAAKVTDSVSHAR